MNVRSVTLLSGILLFVNCSYFDTSPYVASVNGSKLTKADIDLTFAREEDGTYDNGVCEIFPTHWAKLPETLSQQTSIESTNM